MTIAIILLAAGLSTRFGSTNKMAASIGGLPLDRYTAQNLQQLNVDVRIVVTSLPSIAWPDWEVVQNVRPGEGIAHSIGLGLDIAVELGVGAALIALADMPLVPVEHYEQLLSRFRGDKSLVASTNGLCRTPPALFGSHWFPTLRALSGDTGARALLDRAETVSASAECLLDVDRPEDLARIQAILYR